MTKYFAVKDVYGNIWEETVRAYKRDTIKSFDDICGPWKYWRERGYKIVKVVITEVEK